jgi:two-component system sensor kinase FixL
MLVSERQALDEEARRTAFKLQEAQAEAARAARLNLASGMAAALAHELNQPMTAARALTRTAQQLVSQSSGDLARVESNLEAAVDQIDHAASVVRQMREFLRRGESQTMPVDIAKAVGDALVLVQPVATARGIALDLDIDGPLPFVVGNRVQLQQVIINLVNNSMDSIAETKRVDGRVTVVATCSQLRNEIEIKVQDNGMGIPSERMTDIFEPLITSRENGIGLGLSICQSIIQAHHGRIWVSSGDAGATEMTIVLPTMKQPIRKSEHT